MKMAVDASALLAVYLEEPDAEIHLSKLLSATTLWISPINWWEIQARAYAFSGSEGMAKSSIWMEKLGMTVVPVTSTHAQLAIEAFTRYRGRPARLNLGDCFAYALAKEKRVPLLFKGTDFLATDVAAV